jgi:hypothetical protein
MNKNIKIDLTAFTGVGVINLTGKSGKPKKCLVIPIEDNHLYEGEKGIYADFIAWEMRERKENGATHLIKQSLPKEIRDGLTDLEKKALPIFGDLRDAMVEKKELDTYSMPDSIPAQASPGGYAIAPEEVDDLPFH